MKPTEPKKILCIHDLSGMGSVLLGMAAGAALGAVGTMAMAQNQRQVKRTARKLAKGAERAMSQLDTMVTDLVERRMDL